MSQIFTVGDDCLRVNVEAQDDRHSIADQLRTTQVWTEVVVGKQDITLQFDPLSVSPQDAITRLETQLANQRPSPSNRAEIIEIPVSYAEEDAPDLRRISEQVGLTPSDLWAELSACVLTIDMLGFTPGFAYLTGVPSAWEIERLGSPRQSVPAGSIGLLTGQCGLYALEGPGGWPIIGRALVPLFDASATASPLLYKANDRIRFLPRVSADD